MTEWPTTVDFRDPATGETAKVTLPKSREEAKKIVSEIRRMAGGSPADFRQMVRMWTACDLYVLGLLTSAADRDDPYRGRPEIDCDFQFEQARDIQFDSDRVIDYGHRGSWKSTWKIFLKTLQDLFRDPNEAIALMAHEKAAAERHLRRIMVELETNTILKAGWAPDVIYQDPRNREQVAQWSVNSGFVIPGRKIANICPSVAAYTFVHKLATGSRFSRVKLDDCETEETTESEDMSAKIKRRFRNSLNMLGRGAPVEMNGTIHSGTGLIVELLEEGWQGRCRKAEDESLPAPDIAKVYDELNGVDPATGGRIPPAVREVKLAGAPPFWHPIECAIKRWEQGEAVYNQQNMGSAKAGQVRRFEAEWYQWYDETPEERAEGQNLYVVIDPSKGKGDPMFALVVAAHSDETLSIVDGVRKRLTPLEFQREMYMLVAKWMGLGVVVDIRIEEFAQAAFSTHLNDYFQRYKLDTVPARGFGDNRRNKEHERDWTRLEPPFRQGRIFFPRNGIRVEDEHGRVFDLIRDHLIQKELDKFGASMQHDDGIAALSLLFEPVEKAGMMLWTEQNRRPRGRRDEFEDLAELQPQAASWQVPVH